MTDFKNNRLAPFSFSIKSPRNRRLDAQLGAAPVTSLGVVLDLHLGLEAEPVGDGAVLLLDLSQSPLGAESLC